MAGESQPLRARKRNVRRSVRQRASGPTIGRSRFGVVEARTWSHPRFLAGDGLVDRLPIFRADRRYRRRSAAGARGVLLAGRACRSRSEPRLEPKPNSNPNVTSYCNVYVHVVRSQDGRRKGLVFVYDDTTASTVRCSVVWFDAIHAAVDVRYIRRRLLLRCPFFRAAIVPVAL